MRVDSEGCIMKLLIARVRRDGENLIVTDGPFAETKEGVGGFRSLAGEFKGRGNRIAQGISEGCQRWRMRTSPALALIMTSVGSSWYQGDVQQASDEF